MIKNVLSPPQSSPSSIFLFCGACSIGAASIGRYIQNQPATTTEEVAARNLCARTFFALSAFFAIPALSATGTAATSFWEDKNISLN